MRILVVEDEDSIARGLKFNFELEGYQAEIAGDGATALRMFEEADPAFDLVVLDLMLPSMSGYQTCRELRTLSPDVPVLILSARSLSEDRAMAFEVGSDQYMTKPFALPELLARVKNLLDRGQRRAGVEEPGAAASLVEDQIKIGDVSVDFARFEVERDGDTHRMTRIECELLRYFVEHEGIVLPRARIMEDVWEETADITTRSIDNFVMRLRRLIESDPGAPSHLISIWGTGYQFVLSPEPTT